MKKGTTLYCSFCGKSHHEVRKLIVAPLLIGICDECVGLCNQIIAEDYRPWSHRPMLAADIGVPA